MATFSFVATTREGQRRRGTITAATPRLARDQLRDQGLRVQTVTEAREHRKRGITLPFRRRYRTQFALLSRELATLLQVGIPLLDALDTLGNAATGRLNLVLVSVRDKVADGESLATAMLAHKDVFDDMTIGMVKVGEHAGNLDEVLHHVADFLERSGELKNRLQSALLYPAIVFVVSVAVTVFLMTVVVPMLLTSLVEMGKPLPLPTKILKASSDFLIAYGWLLGAVLICAFVGISYYVSTPEGKRVMSQVILRLPLIGMLSQRQCISQMALIVTSLLRSGVPLVDALKICQNASTNILIRDAIADVTVKLESGHDLGDTFKKHKIFPVTLAQVFVLGQSSGELDVMLDRLGRDYDMQAKTISSRVAAAIEPALIVVLSIFVGFIMFATILPILEAGNVIEN